MIRERSAPPECITLDPSIVPNLGGELRRILVERRKQETAVGAKNLLIRLADGFQEFRGQRRARAETGHFRRFGGGPTQSPSFNLIFAHEFQLFVERLSLRRRVELDGRNFQPVKIFDGPFKKLGSDASAAVLRVNQYHSDPRKSIFKRDSRCRAAHPLIFLRDKATFRAGFQKPFPVCRGLIPTGDLLQPQSGRDVRHGHSAQGHGCRIPH